MLLQIWVTEFLFHFLHQPLKYLLGWWIHFSIWLKKCSAQTFLYSFILYLILLVINISFFSKLKWIWIESRWIAGPLNNNWIFIFIIQKNYLSFSSTIANLLLDFHLKINNIITSNFDTFEIFTKYIKFIFLSLYN